MGRIEFKFVLFLFYPTPLYVVTYAEIFENVMSQEYLNQADYKASTSSRQTFKNYKNSK